MLNKSKKTASSETKFLLRGFTLIELLVVIAIIGLLASIVLVSLNTAREKARDTRRLADMKQIILALNMYYDDNGSYPEENSSERPHPKSPGWNCPNRNWQTGFDWVTGGFEG